MGYEESARQHLGNEIPLERCLAAILSQKTRSLGLTFLLCQLEVRCVHGRELGGVPQQSIKNTRVAQMERHVHKGFLSPVLDLLLAIPSKVG